MNRPYDALEVVDKVGELKRVSRDYVLFNHLLLGYPSETRGEFLQMLEAGTRNYDRNFVFTFQAHANTPAWDQQRELGVPLDEVDWREKHVRSLRSRSVVFATPQSEHDFGEMDRALSGSGSAATAAEDMKRSARSLLVLPGSGKSAGAERPKPRVSLLKLRRAGSYTLPAYGTAKLARHLGERTGCDAATFELAEAPEADGFHVPSKLMSFMESDVLAVSVETDTVALWSEVYDWCRFLIDRGYLKRDLMLVAGGAFPTSRPEAVRDFLGSVFVVGEGEQTLVELVDAYAGRKPLRSVDGITYVGDDGQVVTTAPRSPLSLADLPIPLVNNQTGLVGSYRPLDYLSERSAEARIAHVRSARVAAGGSALLDAESYLVPVDQVVETITNCLEIGASEVVFNGTAFLSNREYFDALFSRMASLGLDAPVSFPRALAPRKLEPADLEALRAAGGRHVSIGSDPATGGVGWKALLKDRGLAKRLRELWHVAAGLGFLVQTEIVSGWTGASRADLEALADLVDSEDLHGLLIRPSSSPEDGFEREKVPHADVVDALLRSSADRLGRAGCAERLAPFKLRPSPTFVADPVACWWGHGGRIPA